jgi:hypothetical protein
MFHLNLTGRIKRYFFIYKEGYKMRVIREENGYIMSVTAVIIAVALGLFVIYYSNSTRLSVTTSSGNYSGSQAYWSALGGIEYSIIKMYKEMGQVEGNYSFYNGNVVIDTSWYDQANQIVQLTATGNHSSAFRILRILAEFDVDSNTVDFYGADSFSYGPNNPTHGPTGPGPRYWGPSCLPEAEAEKPEYVLTGADSCYFFGAHVKNYSHITFEPVPISHLDTVIVTLSLAAGVDVPNPAEQSIFQTEDRLEFWVNDILVENWKGNSAFGGNPLSPQVGNSPYDLTPAFTDYTFNITDILGPLSSIQLGFKSFTNSIDKYIGINAMSQAGTGGWVIAGDIVEL